MKTTNLYRHFAADGTLLYVGISLSAVARLAQHRDSKWFDDIALVKISRFESREKALVAEEIAIKTERPVHNIVHGDRVLYRPENLRVDIKDYIYRLESYIVELEASLGIRAEDGTPR